MTKRDVLYNSCCHAAIQFIKVNMRCYPIIVFYTRAISNAVWHDPENIYVMAMN
uniref:Uncharacterized protein n=1 Tax=Arundo donax TaxID=35708 RepID=A0A0A9CN00_ARUDO